MPESQTVGAERIVGRRITNVPPSKERKREELKKNRKGKDVWCKNY